MVATDGHRLIVINDKTGNCGEESKIIRLSKNMILETKKSKGGKKKGSSKYQKMVNSH